MTHSADLDQLAYSHCFQRRGISGFSRTRVKCQLWIDILQVSSKSKPSSVVGSVKRKFVDEEEGEEEEYDPLNPAVGTVASVIRGPARK